jgi:hypothetical protein
MCAVCLPECVPFYHQVSLLTTLLDGQESQQVPEKTISDNSISHVFKKKFPFAFNNL